MVSWQSAERFAERVRARRHIAVRKLAVAGSAVVLVALLGWVALASPLLALRADRVRVEGASELVSSEQLDAATAAYVGVPLTRLDTVALRDRLLEVPGVLDVRVMRDWPHGLVVTVTPRSPVAAVPVDGGFALLDSDGVQLATVAQAPEGLPVVSVPGQDARTLEAVLTVLHALPTELAGQVTAVSASTQDTVALTLADGVTVEWGSAESSALKAAVLATLRADPNLGDASVIDVSAPGMPVVH
ncbi:MAG: cell division protein FtsQ/DivIB [Cellulomonas sp.]|nr:cell division protein FtsQ/DivIB [Cellulomonas sp.]